MDFITSGKTNWGYVIIVALVAVIVATGILWYASESLNVNYQQPSNITTTQNTQQATPTTQATANPNQTSNTNSNDNNYMIQNMKVDIEQQGTGPAAKTGDMVTVNYTGWLTNGTKFDSSLNPGRTPFQFTLGQNQVIQGWELGVLGMKVGETRKLTIPPELGYGAQGAGGGVIPPNATLIFEITLLKIN